MSAVRRAPEPTQAGLAQRHFGRQMKAGKLAARFREEDDESPEHVGQSGDLAEVPLELQHPVVLRLGRDADLGRGATRGASWAASARLGTQVVTFLGTIVTSRLLPPKDFGEAAVVISISAFAAIFSDLGLGSAVIHARRVTERLISSAFWLNFLAGLALSGFVCALSFPLSALYGQPRFIPLMCFSSLNFALNFAVVPTALLERALRFKELAILESIAGIIGVGTLIAAAALGAGTYAIILGPLTTVVLISTFLALRVGWIPRQGPDRGEIARIWRFSRGITGFNSLNYWARNLDNLLLGKFASPTSLGYYVRAYSFMMLPVGQMGNVLERVLFPTLTRLRDDRQRMGRAWLRAISTAIALTLPITVGLTTMAPAFIDVALGRRWLPMTTVLEILTASAIPQLIGATTGGLFRAAGQTDLLFRISMRTVPISIVAILAGLPWGAVGVSVALLVKSWISLRIVLVPCLRICQLRVRDLIYSLRGPIAASASMAGVALVTRSYLSSNHPAWQVLAAQVVLGGTVYLAALWRVDGTPIRLILGRLKRRSALGGSPA